MDTTILGRTGFQVSRMGLGGGGHSRLGLGRGGSPENAAQIVRESLDLGINFIDTAESYGTEEVIGHAITGRRDGIFLSTKVGSSHEGRGVTPEELEAKLVGCLARLQTDYLDVFHLHGVSLDDYPHAREVLLPAMQDLKARGLIRAVGITEQFINDPSHLMLAPAVHDDPWDVVMVGFNLLNPSARHLVLPITQDKGIGTLCMFAVRRALSQPYALTELLAQLAENRQLDLPADPTLGDLVAESGSKSLQELAYRFCLWEPGIDVVLSGTGNLDHLGQNARYLSREALPNAVTDRLNQLFGHLDSVSGN